MTSNLTLRIVSGLTYGFILISACFAPPMVFCAVFIAGSIVCQRELLNIMHEFTSQKKTWFHYVQWINFGLLFTAFYLLWVNSLETWHILAGLAFIYLIALKELFNKKEKAFIRMIVSFFSIIYITIPFLLVFFIYYLNGEPNGLLILGILFILWSNDTGAYFTGRWFGRNKLFERISPKKTIEGSVGGFITALIISYIFSMYVTQLTLSQWLGLCTVVSISSVLGDLVESMIKRSVFAKDSGNLMPGHGGFLDRFDTLLYSMPFAALYLYLIL